MAKFAILLNHPPQRYQNLSEDEYLAVIKDYVAWMEATTAKGVYLGGQKLKDQPGKVLVRSEEADSGAGFETHDSPFLEASEVLGGFMLIEADDMDAAVALVSDHPHLKHNTTLEIREIDAQT